MGIKSIMFTLVIDAGMAALLGPAAARMWRQRTFGRKNRRVSDGASSIQVPGNSHDGAIKAASNQTLDRRTFRFSDPGTVMKTEVGSSHRRTDETGSTLLEGSSEITIANTEDEER